MMIDRNSWFLFGFLLLHWFVGVGFCHAEFIEGHSVSLGPEISYIKYEEPGVMQEEGVMYGLRGAYDYHRNIAFKAEGRVAFGEVDYTSASSGSIDNLNDYIIELRALGGYDFVHSDAVIFTPYVGFGYRYLNDDLRGTTTTGARGYERESNYFYSPLGVETHIDLDNGWFMGFIAEYDLFWKGLQKSHLSDALSGLGDVENDQNDGWGSRGAIRLSKKSAELNLVFEAFIRYWDIDKSEDENLTFSGLIFGSAFEPKNNSTELGVQMSTQF